MCTKFEVSSFSHSKPILGASKLKLVTWRDHALLWMICRLYAGTSSYQPVHHCEDWNETQNVEIGDGFGWKGSAKIIENWENSTVRWSTYIFLFDYNKNCVYLTPFSSYSELFVESRRFKPTSQAFVTFVAVTPFEFCVLPISLVLVNEIPCAIVWHYLYDCMFSHLDAILVYFGRADTRWQHIPRYHSIVR